MSETRRQPAPGGAPGGAVLRRFSGFGHLSGAEVAFLQQLDSRPCPARADILREGETYVRALILEAGWAFRYKLLCDGRRQILNLLIPGDIIGPHSPVADHSVAALTDAVAGHFSPRTIEEHAGDYPHIAATLAHAIAREYEMLAGRAVCLGRRTAYERMAYLMAELLVRLRAVGLSDGHSFDFPVTQEILADSLGLSVVHVNRTLRRLRQDGLLSFQARRAVIGDPEGLADAAALDGALSETMVRGR
ncbi:MAG: Crp/Fnr family transcriptional regulator [Alphaproteobacteria bacterium]